MPVRTTLARMGLALFATVAALAAGELLARLVGFGAMPRAERIGSLDLTPVDDPELQFVNGRDCSFESRYAYDRGRPPLVVRGSTNSAGFRGPELPVERSGGVRIACLGDSYTFGEGVGDDQTWPAQLREVLARRFPQAGVEVLNCGVNAYETRQERRLLETRVLDYAPDLVLLAFFLNDAAVRAEGELAGFEYGRPSWLHRTLTLHEPARTLRSWSRLLDGLADRVVRREYLVFLGESRSRLYAPDSPGWRLAQTELVRARDLCAARGIPFAVVLYPLLFRRGEVLASHEAYRTVAEHCRAHDIAVLDLEPAFLPHDVDALRVHPVDSHPNAEGHRIAAEAIADFVARAGWLERD